jgi:hypothetical protein
MVISVGIEYTANLMFFMEDVLSLDVRSA